MKLVNVHGTENAVGELLTLLQKIHTIGPVSPEILEEISFYKEFHPKEFTSVEEEFVSAMGLFHKIKDPESVYALILKQLGAAYVTGNGSVLTPVQASVRNALDNVQFISISAPTSAGKSFAIRDYIANNDGDTVVIVPSRALIAEYIGSMKRIFGGDKSVMITAFVDKVFHARDLKRIFVLTPERARDIFDRKNELNIEFFFFDEAQISEDQNRGPFFDVLVRRVVNEFKGAKLAFAHPFVTNPGAQLTKHNIDEEKSFTRSYSYGAVGKIHVFKHQNEGFYFFSPYEQGGHLLKNCVTFDGDFKKFALEKGRSTLVFVSKASLYDGSYLEDFEDQLSKFEDISDVNAKRIISDISDIVGADGDLHKSQMIGLLHKGVVIHHGSIPLEVRFLIEDFVRQGFARLCFATSTLVQGVNMPFDVLWLKSMRILGDGESEKSLSLKNLLGRAGRMSQSSEFDYGYVFCKDPARLYERLSQTFEIDPVSAIEREGLPSRDDMAELITSIREGTFDEEISMPLSKTQRLSSPEVQRSAREILDFIYGDGNQDPTEIGGDKKRAARHLASRHFRLIYEASINRSLLSGELSVFEEAIKLMLLMFQAKSFREIAGMRYSTISNRNRRGAGRATFSQRAEALPDARLVRPFPLFKDVLASKVSYDTVVFDTYDYLDKVVSFSLVDAFVATYRLLPSDSNDSRPTRMVELLKFGTNDAKTVMLLRYGFSPDIVGEVSKLVERVDEKSILFKKLPGDVSQELRSAIEWYLEG